MLSSKPYKIWSNEIKKILHRVCIFILIIFLFKSKRLFDFSSFVNEFFSTEQHITNNNNNKKNVIPKTNLTKWKKKRFWIKYICIWKKKHDTPAHWKRAATRNSEKEREKSKRFDIHIGASFGIQGHWGQVSTIIIYGNRFQV